MLDTEKAARRYAVRSAKDLKKEIDNGLASLLSNQTGREYLWWLLSICKLGQNAHTNNALSTAFACGEQNIGQQILAHILEINPAGYVQMMQEQQEKNARSSGTNNGSAEDGIDVDDE